MKSRAIVFLAVFGAFVLGVLSYHPLARAVESFGVATCAVSSGACDGGSNTSTGAGVMGASKKGNGVVAQTQYVSQSASNYRSGLLGKDLSTKGKFDAGVTGTSQRGTGVLGISNTSIGVNGVTQNGTGVWGQDSGGSGQPTGVVGIDTGKNLNGAGIAGQTNVGTGVLASTYSSQTSSQGLLAAAPNGAYVFVGVGPGNYAVSSIDGSGNLQISGLIYTSGQCSGGCARPNRVQSYGTSATTPTLEDTGEAQLANGGAYVRIDRALQSAMDARGYYVLLTPEGDTRGLYVTQRSPNGFAVRENAGGRSNAAFAYRIVARPYGAQQPRLPQVSPRRFAPVLRPPADSDVRPAP